MASALNAMGEVQPVLPHISVRARADSVPGTYRVFFTHVAAVAVCFELMCSELNTTGPDIRTDRCILIPQTIDGNH